MTRHERRLLLWRLYVIADSEERRYLDWLKHTICHPLSDFTPREAITLKLRRVTGHLQPLTTMPIPVHEQLTGRIEARQD